MFCLIQRRILLVTHTAFRTRHFFTFIARRLNDKGSLKLCTSQSLARFNKLSLVGVPGTATTSILDFHKKTISVSNIVTREMPPKKNTKIPDRWMDYQALGKRIPGTRFIAFKVPLKQSLRRCLPPSEAFGPFDLVHLLEEQKEELGLIIDLTFTTRYYNPTDLPDSVPYLKIFTAGHHVPSDPNILSFKKAVYRFLQENEKNDKLIGVHCTHGLNRTGYLVCRYLIDVERMVPSEAVTLFNRSRGHPIERQSYLDDLLSGPERSNEGMEEPDQDPIRGRAGCSQDGPPKCSSFNKSLHQSQSYPGGPTHPPLPPSELRPCGHEQALSRPQHPCPPPCPVLPLYSGAEHNPNGGVALSGPFPSCLQGPQEKPHLAPGKPHKKRHRKNKKNRS
ncbi:hypothetical protein SKAU_G00009000 [Synaphobranchus kaupii]|uniref:RNA/RNP complex-1-interacting phosphatase n=1 Tax=Synaphobranchus kaupii TaxID=118154 RepID=A0A9Q1G9T4_SYNKA|nr:hypothetical protein SKAU_G00009000 [Synaphobranchus kaupii]